MSGHYHDPDCVPDALERIANSLADILEVLLLERIAEKPAEPESEYSAPAS